MPPLLVKRELRAATEELVDRLPIPTDLDRLTPRQAEVLGLIAEGRGNAAIARRL